MKKRVAFVFSRAPHGSAVGREGLDALLATAALCEQEQIGLFFVNDGVLQLLADQRPQVVLARDYLSTFKLLSLYQVKQCYLCQEALLERGFSLEQPLVLPVERLPFRQLRSRMIQFDVMLTF